MTAIESIRFRAEGNLLVLQVGERSGTQWDQEPTWRDAKVQDVLEVAHVLRSMYGRAAAPTGEQK